MKADQRSLQKHRVASSYMQVFSTRHYTRLLFLRNRM